MMKGTKWLWVALLLTVGFLFVSYIPWVNWVLTGPLEEINEWYPSVGNVWITGRVIIRPSAVITCFILVLYLLSSHRETFSSVLKSKEE
jgi:hypothetical protein